jgi:hypothetical protein
VSASVEVNISVEGVALDKREAAVAAVNLALLGTGLPDSKNTNPYGAEYSFSDTSTWEGMSHYSFDITSKSLSVSWDVLSDEFVGKIIHAVHKVDPEAQTSVYVYNLDREPDFEGHTSAYKTIQLV